MKKKSTTKPILAGALPKLATCEDDDQQRELQRLEQADARAMAMVVGGPLLGITSSVRLSQAVDALSDLPRPEDEDTDREDWAYRIGLCVGLRLARALDTQEDGAS